MRLCSTTFYSWKKIRGEAFHHWCWEYLATFPGMLSNIPQNVWRHSPEYNIPPLPIPRLPGIPFSVPVFLVLYISIQLMTVAVTSNSLAKQSSFRGSSFVLTQAEYRKLQRIVERKWNKRIFLLSHENEMSVLWLAFNSHLTEITKAVVRRCCVVKN